MIRRFESPAGSGLAVFFDVDALMKAMEEKAMKSKFACIEEINGVRTVESYWCTRDGVFTQVFERTTLHKNRPHPTRTIRVFAVELVDGVSINHLPEVTR